MDAIYKKLYSIERMVEDLLRCMVPQIARDVDFATLEDLSAQYVGDRNQQRRGDRVWRARLGRSWLHVLLLIEFQSDKARGIMPLRILEYTALLLRELQRKDQLGLPGRWPAPLPIIIYSGTAPWTGPIEMRDLFAPVGPALRPYLPSQRALLLDELRANEDDMPPRNLTRGVVGVEKSRSPGDLVRVTETLDGWLGAGDDELRQVFADWIGDVVAQMRLPGGAPSRPIKTLEDARMTIAERAAEWHKPWVAQGLAQGRAQGREQGLADQRALLRRQAASRFGGEVGDRLAIALGQVADSRRLGDVGEWVVNCSTPEELDARLASLRPAPVNGASGRRR